MSLPRYPKYKDSGVEWLEEVPEHWLVTPLKHGATFVNGCAFKPEQWMGTGTPIIRIENLNGSTAFNYFGGDVDVRYHVEQGDLLFGWSGNIGTSFGPFLWPHPGRHYLNQHIFRICYFTFDKRWFYWVLLAVTSHVEDQAHGIIGMVHVTKGELGAVKIPVPLPPEQQSIASFLDRETGKIDALVAEQEKLLALLAEKRKATISHAVTKGLNPDATMKDSGVEWLGEVPAHWKINRVKHIKSKVENAFVDGPFGSNLKSEHFVVGGDVYVIESNFATQNKIDIEELKTITNGHFQTISRSEARRGDIVIAKIGAQFGKASILPALDKPAVVSGNSLKLTVNNDVCLTEWAHIQLINLKMCGEIDLLSNGSAQPALSLGGMNNLIFLLPPLPEQQSIIEFLDRETTKLDTLTTEATRAIVLLKERRTALISAAVTGKIDLRNTIATQEECHA